ncbi:hypothetical protein KUTeg_012205 [Tegillarca granosa]|uniref:Uncharacterized protein n=1 Tax=Tegillarca granosa TaxID=220873 RepID=A0ABQ9EYV8_TEGGR|nr:hypothetical protein KUTeg_012205 [Tegillarca granosa]
MVFKDFAQFERLQSYIQGNSICATSGFDLYGIFFPLRTNYELVRILKTYNSANDLEGTRKRYMMYVLGNKCNTCVTVYRLSKLQLNNMQGNK